MTERSLADRIEDALGLALLRHRVRIVDDLDLTTIAQDIADELVHPDDQTLALPETVLDVPLRPANDG